MTFVWFLFLRSLNWNCEWTMKHAVVWQRAWTPWVCAMIVKLTPYDASGHCVPSMSDVQGEGTVTRDADPRDGGAGTVKWLGRRDGAVRDVARAGVGRRKTKEIPWIMFVLSEICEKIARASRSLKQKGHSQHKLCLRRARWHACPCSGHRDAGTGRSNSWDGGAGTFFLQGVEKYAHWARYLIRFEWFVCPRSTVHFDSKMRWTFLAKTN